MRRHRIQLQPGQVAGLSVAGVAPPNPGAVRSTLPSRFGRVGNEAKAIEVVALSLRYSTAWALKDCSVSIPEGRIAALVGPNGAGKTTLLQILVGLQTPTAGSVQILGQAAPPLTKIGFVAQDKPMFIGLTVAETLKIGRVLNPVWDNAYAQRRLATFNIPLSRKIAKLSGGQRTQVALTMALAKLPDMLVLDEPFADLDPFARGTLLNDLMSVTATRGLSVIFSTHVISDLQAVCSWLVIMKQGRVLLSEDMEQVCATHWSVTTAPRSSASSRPSPYIVIHTSTFEGTTKQLIRSSSKPPYRSGFDTERASLEDVVVGYIAG